MWEICGPAVRVPQPRKNRRDQDRDNSEGKAVTGRHDYSQNRRESKDKLLHRIVLGKKVLVTRGTGFQGKRWSTNHQKGKSHELRIGGKLHNRKQRSEALFLEESSCHFQQPENRGLTAEVKSDSSEKKRHKRGCPGMEGDRKKK